MFAAFALGLMELIILAVIALLVLGGIGVAVVLLLTGRDDRPERRDE
jgi:hypothetical protein